MKERGTKIGLGLVSILLVAGALLCYIRYYLYFDIPACMIYLPILGGIATALFGKYGWLILPVNGILDICYQMVEGRRNTFGVVDMSKPQLILNILPPVLMLLALGCAGGILIHMAIAKKGKRLALIPVGLILVFGVGGVFFHNPFYPVAAQLSLNNYAKKYDVSDYPVERVEIFFSQNTLEYEGRVVKVDGKIYPLYHHKKTGKVTEGN